MTRTKGFLPILHHLNISVQKQRGNNNTKQLGGLRKSDIIWQVSQRYRHYYVNYNITWVKATLSFAATNISHTYFLTRWKTPKKWCNFFRPLKHFYFTCNHGFTVCSRKTELKLPVSCAAIVVCIPARILNKMLMMTTVRVGWRQ